MISVPLRRSTTCSAAGAGSAREDALRRRYYRVPRRLVHLAVLFLVAVAFVGLVGLGVWLRAMAGFLIVPEDLPPRADAVVVMGGGGRGATRETQAAKLYRAGLASVVVTTGGPVAGETAPATYAEWSVQRLERRGVPRTAVQPTNAGDSTSTDALGTRRLAEARGWRDLIVVTDNWHSRRTMLVFEDAFRGSSVRLHYSPARDPRFRPETWWLHEESAQNVTTEYIKLLAYLLRVGG